MKLLRVLLIATLALGARAQDLGELTKKLADTNEKTRREAVQELAKEGSAAAWKLVLSALADASPMVADEAQIQLGSVATAALFEPALGKDGLAAKDDWVRLRVAEAIGRVNFEIPAAELAKRLTDKSDDVRRAACWSIERLADAKHLEAKKVSALREDLAKLAAKDKNEEVRAAAVCAWAAVSDKLTSDDLKDYMAAKSSAVNCAALIAVERLPQVEVFALASVTLISPRVGEVTQAVELLSKLGTAAAARALANGIDNQITLRLKWTIVETLQRMSGLKHRLDSRPWIAWAKSLPDGWTAPSEAEKKKDSDKAPDKADGEQKTVTFVGLPILSESVVFLIDLSGSMWEKVEGSKTRKEIVDGELARALEGLRPGTRFNVIPFTAAPIPWQPKLAVVNPENVKKALAFFAGRHDQGKGNYWDALELALEDPDVDTVIVLGDGAPTGGHRWNMELIKDLFAERNRFHRVSVSAVLVGASKFLTTQWTELCEASHGTVLAAELKH